MKASAKSPAELLAPDRPLTLSNVADGAEGLVVADLARAVAARKNPPATSALVICRDGQRMTALVGPEVARYLEQRGELSKPWMLQLLRLKQHQMPPILLWQNS